jgi:cardiolipin synthase
MMLDDIWPWFRAFLTISTLVGVVTIAYMIMRQNGNPTKTLTWILLVIFVPLIGALLYFTFGINYRRIKLYKRKRTKDIERYHQIVEDEYYNFEQSSWIEKEEVKAKAGLAKLLLKGSKSLFTDNNRVEVLQDGPVTYKRILEELKTAQHFIHIQFYIFEEGEMADELLEVFTQKRQEGVEIRLIYDAVGSWSLSKNYKDKLDEIGVEHHEFLPVKFVQLANKINYRNHRKIVVIDSKKGFTGGINISDKYLHGDELGSWRDTFLFLEGNAVNGLQYLFLSDWNFATHEDRLKPEYFKRSERLEGSAVQIVGSGPDSDYAGIMQEYDTMIHSANEYIYIANPYLIPGEVIQSALISAAMRGVDVRIMIPGVSDFKIVKWSSHSYLSPLLRAGVKIYRYQGGFLHSKVIVSDDMISSVGTGNMDIRSFEYNFEVNAVIYDNELAKELRNTFLSDIKNCHEVIYEVWKKRPLYERILESISRLVSPLL